VEQVEEDWIYEIWQWEAHRRGRTDKEGGRRDLLAMKKDNVCAFFYHLASGKDEEEWE
jgi:hypothetical protein